MATIYFCKKMHSQKTKPVHSSLRNSYTPTEYLSLYQSNIAIQPPPGLSLPQPYHSPSIPIINNSLVCFEQLKTLVMDTMKSITYRNNGVVYGEYLINEIYARYMTDEYYRKIASIFQSNQNHNTLEYYMKNLNNPDVLPEYASRIHKHTNTMNILINQSNIQALHNEINTLLGTQYNIQVGKYQTFTDIYPYLDNESFQLGTYSITFENAYLAETLTINIVVYFSSPITLIPQLPYGIYDCREQYLMFDGIKYILPECILATFGKDTSLEQSSEKIIYNIQHQTYTVLPNCYNSDDFKEKMEKMFANKNVILDFITDITNNALSDYYITNWHDGFTCTACNVPIDSGERCCILKCCNIPYHTTCLMKCYIDPEVENYKGIKCNSCGVAKDDIARKNCSILMGISG